MPLAIDAETHADLQRQLSQCESDGQRMAAGIGRLREALETCQSWMDRWTQHVGSCEGGDICTCGRTAALYEAGAALDGVHQQSAPENPNG